MKALVSCGEQDRIQHRASEMYFKEQAFSPISMKFTLKRGAGALVALAALSLGYQYSMLSRFTALMQKASTKLGGELLHPCNASLTKMLNLLSLFGSSNSPSPRS
jgi:hypothetical protein